MSDRSVRQDIYNRAIHSGDYRELYKAIKRRCLNCNSGRLRRGKVSCSHWMHPGSVACMGEAENTRLKTDLYHEERSADEVNMAWETERARAEKAEARIVIFCANICGPGSEHGRGRAAACEGCPLNYALQGQDVSDD